METQFHFGLPSYDHTIGGNTFGCSFRNHEINTRLQLFYIQTLGDSVANDQSRQWYLLSIY